MSDPLSHVASWLTPATAETRPLPAEVVDPVLALIAEVARLDALCIAAQSRGDEIFDTLPEDIRKGRVQISFSDSELGRLLQHSGLTSEAHLHRWVHVHRRLATVLARLEVKMGRLGDEDLAAEEAAYAVSVSSS